MNRQVNHRPFGQTRLLEQVAYALGCLFSKVAYPYTIDIFVSWILRLVHTGLLGSDASVVTGSVLVDPILVTDLHKLAPSAQGDVTVRHI